MGWESEYSEYDVVKDWTKPLSKIWDNLMPEIYPFVLSFETKYAKEVKKTKKMGPYHMTEHFIDYDCSVILDKKPLQDIGWESGPISKVMAYKAYGEHYFNDMRNKLVSLSNYAGLNFSQFDFGGILNASVKD